MKSGNYVMVRAEMWNQMREERATFNARVKELESELKRLHDLTEEKTTGTEYVIEIFNDRWIVLRTHKEHRYTNKKTAIKDFNKFNKSYACLFRLVQATREVIRP